MLVLLAQGDKCIAMSAETGREYLQRPSHRREPLCFPELQVLPRRRHERFSAPDPQRMYRCRTRLLRSRYEARASQDPHRHSTGFRGHHKLRKDVLGFRRRFWVFFLSHYLFSYFSFIIVGREHRNLTDAEKRNLVRRQLSLTTVWCKIGTLELEGLHFTEAVQIGSSNELQ